MLRKKSKGLARGAQLSRALAGVTGGAVDRRTFLRNSGLAAGGLAAAGAFTGATVRKAAGATVGRPFDATVFTARSSLRFGKVSEAFFWIAASCFS